ncbi:MAG: hypothetical protein RI958_2297 [Actinomycetota bacterium]|jgi:predicted dienelactone hydrolase
MSSAELSAGQPVEPPRHPVGRRSLIMIDPERGGRMLGVDIWYPAAHHGAREFPVSEYELFPGVSFTAASARQDAPVLPGRFPLIVLSHGRTGMRFAYAMLCEALAARGALVVSADHPGDALADWLLGTHVDDRTNEINRVGDAHLLVRALVHGHESVPLDVLDAVDHDRVVLAGHSYGAYTALATVAGARGVAAHERISAVVVYQPYTRTMSDSLLGRVNVPTLLVVSGRDRVTPPESDAERPWALVRGRPTWRLDLPTAGHQASSDIGLYHELADRVTGLPAVVREYLDGASADAVAVGMPPWRAALRAQVAVTWAFLDSSEPLDARLAGLDAVLAPVAATLQRR